jgi:hypothetical protein
MTTAASTRPPKVLISTTTASAFASVASASTRSTKGASPRSIMPSMGAVYTTAGAAVPGSQGRV